MQSSAITNKPKSGLYHNLDYCRVLRSQLMNGKLFCDWLGGLYRAHKHDLGNLVYIGLLIWQPRRESDRDTTQLPAKPKKHLFFDNFFDIKNKKDIYLKELIRQLE